MKYVDDFKNPDAATQISSRIRELAAATKQDTINIMEVCGSHTMAIARYAIRDVLPEKINLTSGPGCPVCVTDSGYIDTAITLAQREDTIVTTFGDMINVPGTSSTLAKARAEGASVEVCYSPLKAVELAKENPDQEVVFLAIGFETTIAPVVSIVDIAVRESIGNLSILTAFKLVPPALETLAADPELKIDAFLCPAHVSAVIGAKSYEPFVNKHRIPCVIASFEPVDILLGIQKILEQIVAQKAFVDNQYQRVVKYEGNTLAQKLLSKYLTNADVAWRGIGVIPGSGLRLRDEFSQYDTERRLGIPILTGKPDKNCRCGDVLKGKIKPVECPVFAKACNPFHPVGPCMVSAEGTCSAFYKYLRDK